MSPETTSPLDVRYGARLRAIREERSITQAQLVESLKRWGIDYMNTSTLSRIESGVRPVRLVEAQAVSRILQVSAESMIADSEVLAFYESRARNARQRFVGFREAAVDVTQAQLQLVTYLPALRELLDGDLDADLRVAVEDTLRNIEGYVAIDLAQEATDLAQQTRESFESREGSSAGRFLNSRRV